MTREEAIRRAGKVWAAACARQDAQSPREAAEEAFRPGGLTVDQIEDKIRARRGLPPLDREGPTDTSPPTG
jgi:hypothetical protein